MKSMIIITGKRRSGKSYVAQALADRNGADGEKVAVFDPVNSVNDVKLAYPKVPNDTIGIFVCGPNFTFDTNEILLESFVTTTRISLDRFTAR